MYLITEELIFPPVQLARPEGILAVGGDLSIERLKLAYTNGIFPWYNEGEPIIWYSPDPRMVLFPNDLKVSKSMRKVMASNQFTFTENKAFDEVISHCKTVPRSGQGGTWITNAMQQAYCEMHKNGWASSVEVWQEGKLVGGLYGIDLGNVFCGESMFSLVSNASKAGFIHLTSLLVDRGYHLIDCQVYNEHLASLGAIEIPRMEFLNYLKESTLGT